jgi:4-amino-4-deoxy-L-arabinose transferase-like glycosyltransferase
MVDGLGSRRDVCLLAVIVLGGAALRFGTLGIQSIWTDEALTAGYLQGSLRHLLITLPLTDANPPLFYVLEWVFVRIFGQGDAGLRVLSALAGTLTVPVLYGIGASIASRQAGLIAAALGAVQPMLWWYSQEARVYALFTLLSALGLFAFVIAVRDRSTWALGLWALSSGLMLTTHYFSLFLIAPQAILLIAIWRGRRREVVLTIAALGLVGVALSVTFALELQLTGGIGNLPLGPRTRVLVPQLLASPSPPGTLVWLGAGFLVLVGAALALLTTPPSQRHFARVLAVLTVWDLVVPVAAALAGKDYIVTRNLIATLVPLLVLVGIGFASPRATRYGLAGAAATVALGLGAVCAIAADPGLQRIDIKAAVASLGHATVDRVVLSPGSYLFASILPRYLTPSSVLNDVRVPVAEVDVLVPRPGSGTPPCLAGQACELFATEQRLTPPAPGFRLVSRKEVEPFTVIRWRAPVPKLLNLSDLAQSAPHAGQVSPIALYQQSEG